MIDAFLFDMDGVLADSEDISITIGREYFESLGYAVTSVDFAPHLGMGEVEFFDGVARDKNVKGYSYKEASAFFKSKYEDYIKNVNIALPGLEIIKNAKKAGIKVAIASSAPEWKVYVNVDKLGLKDEVDLIVTGKDVTKNKPNGEIYKKCLEFFNVKGENAIVFEDSKGGIEAGKDAKCNVVSLLTTINLTEAWKKGADAVIENLSAVPNFSTKEEFFSFFTFIKEGEGEKRRYGRNLISPMHKCLNVDRDSLAIKEAWRVRENAYTPFSHFKVGASIISVATGKIYSGCNVENSSYGATICAERNAILNAISNEGIIGIDALFVATDGTSLAFPCAECLQVIAEFSSPETRIVLINNKEKKEYKFSDLLPHPFIF